MRLFINYKILILKIFLSIIFFLLISLFASAQKILIILFFSILFFLIKTKYQKIITINLIILVIFTKIIILPFQLKMSKINPNKSEIYEKHFLYGVRNLNFMKDYKNGDLSSLNQDLKIKYKNLNSKKIKIITDNLGFRNEILPNDADYILIGDSFVYQSNINQKELLNYIINCLFLLL